MIDNPSMHALDYSIQAPVHALAIVIRQTSGAAVSTERATTAVTIRRGAL